MYCAKCGSKIYNDAKFCNYCGEKQIAIKPNLNVNSFDNNEYDRNYLLCRDSIKNISAGLGYYCPKCGNYINYARSLEAGLQRCHGCKAPIIGVDNAAYLKRSVGTNGLIGSLLYASIATAITLKDSVLNKGEYELVSEYYNSEYYRQNKYPFESVVSDKGRVGEYLLVKEFHKVRNQLGGKSLHLYYNLYIPEPNGSFQEIDAIVIYKNLIIVIESKNRDGYFEFTNLDDKYWRQKYLDGNEEEILNPFIQNLEHISALRHFLKSFKEIRYANLVVLGNYGRFDSNSTINKSTNIKLEDWAICNVSRLSEMIVDFVERFEKDYQVKDEMYTKSFIKTLLPSITMTNEEKSLLMQERDATKSEHIKYDYNYYLIQLHNGKEVLLRENGCYIHEYDIQDYAWRDSDDFYYDNRKICCLQIIKQIWDLDSPLKIVKAYEGLLSGYSYGTDDRESESTDGKNDNQQDDSYIYFAGCDNYEKFIKRYKALCKIYHPDNGIGDEETFKMIQREYELLKDKL